MRVLIANDLYGRSSAAGVAVRLAEGLARRGLEVGFLATTQKPGEGRRFTENGVTVFLEETPAYNLRWRAWRSLDNPAGVAAMSRVVNEFRPRIAHVHNLHLHLSYACLAAARERQARTVLHVHDIMPVCHQKMFCHLDERLQPGDPVRYVNGPVKCALCVKGRYNPLRNAAIQRVLARDVDRLVVVSDAMGDALAQNGIGPATTIWNALPLEERHASPAAVAALSARLGLTGRRVIFHGGRLDRLKGSLELVRAFALVRRAVPDAALLTVGEAQPGFRDEIESLAERLDVRAGLVHAGWLTGEELLAAYELSDVIATPSLCFESFGLLNVEAMALRKPVLASMWGGPSDVVQDGVTGYLVNPLHVRTMADRLTALLSDRALARRMGAAGRERLERMFGLEAQLDRTLALYSELGIQGVPAA
jgi:glycosyltransferase involved in cell wall biosynthesis